MMADGLYRGLLRGEAGSIQFGGGGLATTPINC